MNGLVFLFFIFLIAFFFVYDNEARPKKYSNRALHKKYVRMDSSFDYGRQADFFTQYFIFGLFFRLSFVGGFLRFITGFFPKGQFPYPVSVVLNYLFDSK